LTAGACMVTQSGDGNSTKTEGVGSRCIPFKPQG
jgi:hypothetical protein